MADKNVGAPVRFENGGTVEIATNNILAIVEGSLEYTVPGYEPVLHMDRGVIKDPVVGNERRVTGKLALKYTSLLDSDGVQALLMGALVSTRISNVTAAGLLFTFSMVVKTPDYKGAITGDSVTFGKCSVDALSIKTKAGAEFDTIEFDFTDHEASPVFARY